MYKQIKIFFLILKLFILLGFLQGCITGAQLATNLALGTAKGIYDYSKYLLVG